MSRWRAHCQEQTLSWKVNFKQLLRYSNWARSCNWVSEVSNSSINLFTSFQKIRARWVLKMLTKDHLLNRKASTLFIRRSEQISLRSMFSEWWWGENCYAWLYSKFWWKTLWKGLLKLVYQYDKSCNVMENYAEK